MEFITKSDVHEPHFNCSSISELRKQTVGQLIRNSSQPCTSPTIQEHRPHETIQAMLWLGYLSCDKQEVPTDVASHVAHKKMNSPSIRIPCHTNAVWNNSILIVYFYHSCTVDFFVPKKLYIYNIIGYMMKLRCIRDLEHHGNLRL